MKRLLAAPVVLFCLVYLGDYLSLRFRFPNHRPQFGSVVVQQYYAVPLKNHKTEYMFDQPATRTCVYSLFPHFGDPPCWYLGRHRWQEIKARGARPLACRLATRGETSVIAAAAR